MTSDRERFERLSSYLKQDPENLGLIAQTATAALEAGLIAEAMSLVERHAEIAPPPLSLQHLLGLAALEQNRPEDAAAIFESLLARTSGEPSLKWNLAWAKGRLNDHQAVVDLIDDEVATAVDVAAAQKIRSMHSLGDLDAALAEGQRLMTLRPDDRDLKGAVAMAALDIGDLALARQLADQSGDGYEALAARGSVTLADGDLRTAAQCFDRAEAALPDGARAQLGQGLVLMAQSQPMAAAQKLDRAAELFEDHLGSWVAAGWAHYLAGDMTLARARFEHALALDDTFAETHGGMAMIDLASGDRDSARRHAQTAIRLDRHSLGGSLVTSILLEEEGRSDQAERIRQATLRAEVGPNGKSLLEAMSDWGLRRR